MPQGEISQDVKALIAEHITSVEQLEILLLLARDPEREWTVPEVADEIRTNSRSAVEKLADLAERGFLTASAEPPDRYRFRPATEALGRAVRGLEAAYREFRFTVIELIFSRPIKNLHVYADAFRFRKGDRDDG